MRNFQVFMPAVALLVTMGGVSCCAAAPTSQSSPAVFIPQSIESPKPIPGRFPVRHLSAAEAARIVREAAAFEKGTAGPSALPSGVNSLDDIDGTLVADGTSTALSDLGYIVQMIDTDKYKAVLVKMRVVRVPHSSKPGAKAEVVRTHAISTAPLRVARLSITSTRPGGYTESDFAILQRPLADGSTAVTIRVTAVRNESNTALAITDAPVFRQIHESVQATRRLTPGTDWVRVAEIPAAVLFPIPKSTGYISAESGRYFVEVNLGSPPTAVASVGP
jgi:hypothetical protein